MVSYLLLLVLAAGELTAEEPAKDFGRVWARQVLHHSFVLRNTGATAARIEGLKISCGCIIEEEFDPEIAPGKTGRVSIAFESRAFRGPIEKTFEVKARVDGEMTMIPLLVRADVIHPLILTPEVISFGSLAATTTAVREISIVNNTPEPLRPGEPGCDGPFRATLLKGEEGKVYTIRVTTAPPLLSGPSRATLTIETGLSMQPRLEIPVMAYVAPAVLVSPPVIVVPATRGETIRRNVYLRHARGEAFKILSAVAEAPSEAAAKGISLEITDHRPPGRAYRLLVSLDPGLAVSPKGLTLLVKTDVEDQPVIAIPVRLLPRDGERADLIDKELEDLQRRAMRRASRKGGKLSDDDGEDG
jgi:hypothetical protein